METPLRIKTISDFHKLRGLPGPNHPLVSVVNYDEIKHAPENNLKSWILDFYSISVKRNPGMKMKYGQQQYDFDDGVMFFMAPNQVFGVEYNPDAPPVHHKGWMLLIHPDFLWNTPLAKSIKQYDYFGYAVKEALWLSENEEQVLSGIIDNIKNECRANIDTFTQNIVIAQIELLLAYGERFYQRQFITRKVNNHQLLDGLESVLENYFNADNLADKGLPTVQYIADALHVSPNYLSGVLKSVTGLSTQQHIHEKLIEKAKQELSATTLSVSEIAYRLGFEHPQSFSKLFKAKTNLSPQEFRQSFN
ncbi:helix-turn-helix domain-containing protein [Flavobacterium sp. RHBU_3]|uniref:helix-turn-helix domain-containing protein n=1 Tax=Flavobacterium sp. RHBU_3 TaxID=3391184 RepID=UPI0039854BFB